MDLVLEFVLELLGAVCEAVAAIYPPLQAALLVLGALLFGFCSYVFFDTANPAGGIMFAVFGAGCLALLVYGLVKGSFRKPDTRSHPGRGRRK